MSKLVLAARERRNRVLVALSVLVAAVSVPSMASAAAGDATYSLAGATDGIVDQVTGVLTTVLPIAGGLIALFVGWKILKRFVKSA